MSQPVPVVLAGARGHGWWHLENLRRLSDLGRVRLAGVCELAPLAEEELAGFAVDGRRPEQDTDLGRLLERTGARIAILCTPIPTHLPLALTVARRGVHLLLEKPPTPSYAEFEQLTEGLRQAGVVCQIGFQSLGSHAVTAIRALVHEGAVGRVRGIGAAGAWVRDEAYFTRVPWAGRRRLDGRDVVDGVLTNPLAHAVATALRLAGSDRAEDLVAIETQLSRANAIEADDTSALRLRTTRGGVITAAVTLCAERPAEPYVVVHGDQGRITFWYKQDQVRLERAGHPPETTQHSRADLLENLLEHLADRDTELLVPPERAGAFMRVVEAVRTAPDPHPLPAGVWRSEPGERAPRRVVPGIDALVDRSASTLALYSELDAPWAPPPTAVILRAGAAAPLGPPAAEPSTSGSASSASAPSGSASAPPEPTPRPPAPPAGSPASPPASPPESPSDGSSHGGQR